MAVAREKKAREKKMIAARHRLAAEAEKVEAVRHRRAEA
jgi:hypothetical protein